MTITTGENPDQPNVIRIDRSINPEDGNFEGAEAVFFDEALDRTYDDPSTGLEDEAQEWSERFPKIARAAELSGPELTRRFVEVDGDWLSLVPNTDPDSPEIEAHMVTSVNDKDFIVADLNEDSIEPRIKATTPGDVTSIRIRQILSKYADNTELLESTAVKVAEGLEDPQGYTERHSPVIEEEFGEDLPKAA